MKLYIEHTKILHKTDINGKPLQYFHEWRVYRRIAGIVRFYIQVRPDNNRWRITTEEVAVSWTSYSNATNFLSKEDAEDFILKVKQNPSRFVIYR